MEKPKVCRICNSYYWNQPRKRRDGGGRYDPDGRLTRSAGRIAREIQWYLGTCGMGEEAAIKQLYAEIKRVRGEGQTQ